MDDLAQHEDLQQVETASLDLSEVNKYAYKQLINMLGCFTVHINHGFRGSCVCGGTISWRTARGMSLCTVLSQS